MGASQLVRLKSLRDRLLGWGLGADASGGVGDRRQAAEESGGAADSHARKLPEQPEATVTQQIDEGIGACVGQTRQI